MPTHSYTAAGIYDVCLTVNDGSVDSDPACTLAVVYDPNAGFVTGGGWITSPAGAYKPDPEPERQGHLRLRLEVREGRDRADRQHRVPVPGRQP